MKKYFQAPWSTKETIIIFATTITLMILAMIAGNQLQIFPDKSGNNVKILKVVAAFILQWTILLIPIIFITKKKYRNLAKNLGFEKTGILKTIGYIVKSYLTYIIIVFLILLGILYLDLKIPGFQAQKELLPLFGTAKTNLVVAGIIAIVIGPIVEEIFFRGFLLRSLSNQWGIITANISTAAIFALFHMQLQSIIPIFILGLIINKIVIDSKSIVPAIAFHVFNNAVAFTISVILLKDAIPIENITN